MDSFFDFDASLPPVDGGGRSGRRNADSEDEYDALNDETFGDPDKGDWENMHETLVKLEKGPGFLLNDEEDDREGDALFDDDELDLHLSRFDFGDGDESIGSTADLSLDDDIGSRLRLDPSIWDSPVKKMAQPVPAVNHEVQNLFPILPPMAQNGLSNSFRPNSYPVPPAPIKMLSVEDIERNIIQQQQQQQLQQQHQEQLKREREHFHQQQQKVLQENQKNKAARKVMVPLVTPALQPMVPPAQLLAIRNQMFPHPQLLPQPRMPLGFLPYNFLPPPFSTPINNLAMHPGFPAAAQLGMFPPHQRIPLPIQPNLVQNLQNNQFNKRLVQEIQQNHPLLALNRQNYQYNNNNINNNNQKRYYNAAPKGPDYDEYANLMSNREKQWLIGIQLTQLNSDAPYINDYYFTVYKERLAARNGNRESKAYKDNQLNHPFTQPTGHAQLLLMSSLAKNCGMLNAKGGLLNRERHNSESKNNSNNNNGGGADQKDQQPPRTYTPLQFENSLGKLQCGSVTAPRKIIDMDVVGAESTQAGTTTTRELLHRLLHIEKLFKVVLKMEDLNNPVAIEAALVAKEKREKDRQVQEVASTNSSLSASAESFDELLAVLIGGLAQDKVIPMLGVRKGKILLRRILVLLRDHPYRWTLWATTFSTLPFMLKKDRDDPEGVLFALYTEFERHAQYSNSPDLLKLSQVLASDKNLAHLTSCKFLLSSTITIIFQMEIFFTKAPDAINAAERLQWIEFLDLVTGVVGKQPASQQHMIKLDRGNNIVRLIRAHLERFLQVKGNDFVSFITAPDVPEVGKAK
uniref:Protein PAT1 homolog 1 n=1 Tax=Culex pipiens TaxID=7175 RepID=A0A8D8IFW3_CULPI